MVGYIVYTNTRSRDICDMYYNTPFPHNVFSIVTIFILLACFPSESYNEMIYYMQYIIRYYQMHGIVMY